MRLFGIALILGLAACQPQAPQPDGVANDLAETYRRTIRLPAENLAIEVLFGDKDAFICEGKRVTARELFEEKDAAHPYKSGYYFVDVDRQDTSYRAYFRKEYLVSPSEATYIFCSGSGSELTGSGCALAGVTEKRCFESYIARANTVELFDKATSALQRNKGDGGN